MERDVLSFTQSARSLNRGRGGGGEKENAKTFCTGLGIEEVGSLCGLWWGAT